MAPSFTPFYVDTVRIGGSLATQRHGFSVAPKPQVEETQKFPRWLPPPPRRMLLSAGKAGRPSLSESEIEEIRQAAQEVAEALRLDIEAVKEEARWVSGPSPLPEEYREIEAIGPHFTLPQLRNVVVSDARAIDTTAARLRTGTVGPYLTSETAGILDTVAKDAKALIDYVQQFGTAPVVGSDAWLAEEHTAYHVQEEKNLVAAIERQVVSKEASSVPVREPGERSGAWGTVFAAAVLVAAGFLLAEII